MSRKKTWSNVPFTFSCELYCHNKKIYESVSDQEVDLGCDIPITEESDATFELVIEGTSSGYCDPGCTYGPPEKCYPPEGEDERTFDSIYVLRRRVLKIRLGRNDTQGVKTKIEYHVPCSHELPLFSQFREQIQNIEIGLE